MIHLFADDISVAVAHKDRRLTIVLSGELAAALLEVLRKLGLEVAQRERKNSLINKRQEDRTKTKEDRLSSTKWRLKEQNIHRTSQDLDKLESQQQREDAIQLPFQWAYSFKLLGVIRDCNWS